MAHTHTLEIITPNIALRCERTFKNGVEASISIDSVSMTDMEHACIDKLLRVIAEVHEACGGITKIELIEI